jgi:GDP/UDP-N,N'-diacetylbacillosamine 2-epimerase (hydrolysing)
MALLLLHPSGGTTTEEQSRTELILSVLKQRSLPFQCIGPNNDPGHEGILKAHQRAGVPLLMSQSQEEFWRTLVDSSLLIGNSSAGIIEAASLALPVVNIGPRQLGRERNPNVLDVPFQASAIDRAITRALSDDAFLKRVRQRKNLYGRGNASTKIVKALEAAAAQGIHLVKHFQDVT